MVLAEAGATPLVLERGGPVSLRAEKVNAFWRHGVLDPECNTLFGAGGAGLFSDGKLTARTKDREGVRRFFSMLVRCGAPESILIDSEPHLGSDLLQTIIENMIREINRRGGEVRFHTRVDGFIRAADGHLTGLQIGAQVEPAAACIVAAGHSARDLYQALFQAGVSLEAKPFAVGVRLELPQPAIDRAMFGRFAGHPKLGAASFKLTRREEEGTRACYTFCMCPGGLVIGCAAEPGQLTTNGMSYSKRSAVVGNAAFLVPVLPADFSSCLPESLAKDLHEETSGTERSSENVHPLAGLSFQAAIEKKAFAAGGGNFMLPTSDLASFLAGHTPSTLPQRPRSCLRATPADLGPILPDFVLHTLRVAIPKMLRLMPGIDPESALLYAAETRSSSPVRMSRTDEGCSLNTPGLFPAGEGSGSSGGIVSSALDGLKAAEAVLRSMAG
jgi:uncharacterized protein